MRIHDASLFLAITSAATALITAVARIVHNLLIVRMALRDTRPEDRDVILARLAQMRPFCPPRPQGTAVPSRKVPSLRPTLERPASQKMQHQPSETGEQREPP